VSGFSCGESGGPSGHRVVQFWHKTA